MLQEKLTKFKELIDTEWDKSVQSELKQIADEIKSEINAVEEKHLKDFITNPENDPNEYEPIVLVEKDQFKELNQIYRDKKKAVAEARAREERANQSKKEKIIADIIKLTEEENIGKAYNTFKELNEAFKETGRVPGDQHADIQTQYHNACDKFFYNIRIYQDLKELDLKTNLTVKKELVQKIKALINEQPKTAEQQVKLFVNEWYETGPVPKEEYEALKEDFKKACDDIWEKIKTYHQLRKEALVVNLEKKKALLEKTQALVNKERNSIKDWNQDTKNLLATQEEWKAIGYGPKKENEEIWQEFRTVCDDFFASKKVFFEGLHEEQDVNKLKKLELIEKAEAISDSTDWANTTKKLIRLQEDWKKIGPARQGDERKLWTQFREACNKFFDAKTANFKKNEADQEENLKAKKAVIAELESLEIKSDKKDNIQQLKGLISKFNSAGHVPKKNIKEISTAYETALENYLEKAGLKKAEIEQSRFVAKIEGMLNDDNSDERIKKEIRFLRDKISQQESELRNLERNLSFFSGNSSNPLLKEAELKVSRCQETITKLNDQIILIKKMKKEAEKVEATAETSESNEEKEVENEA